MASTKRPIATDAGLKAVRVGITRNIGNFESVRLDVEIEAQTGETYDECLGRCQTLVSEGLQETQRTKDRAKLEDVATKMGLDLSVLFPKGRKA